MALITSWSLQSPDTTAWQATISAHGVVTFAPIGGPITITPPVYGDQLNVAIVHTPSISNAGVVTITSGADTGQLRAALLDPNGAQHVASVVSGIVYWIAPKLSIGDLVTFGLFDQESVPLLVKSIEPGSDWTARITLVDAAAGVHLAASGEIPAFESHITLPQIGQEPVSQPLIDHVASDETVMLRSSDGSLVPRILVSLHFSSGAARPASHLEVQHRLTGSVASWERQVFVAASTVEVSITTVMEGLTYDLRFRALTVAGQASDWVQLNAVGVIGKTSPPPDVAGLSLNGQQLVWTYANSPPDFDGFLVRVHVGARTSWGDALPLHDGLVGHTSFLLFRDTGTRTYLVKAVDTSGNESLTPGTIFVDYGALVTQNIAEIVDLKALGFPGTITAGSVLGGNLVANSDTLFWKSDGLPFWTLDAAPMWPGTFTEMIYTATITPPLAWLGGILLLDLIVQANGWRLEYTQDSGALFWGDPSAPVWSTDGALFWAGQPSAFAPWPGQLTGYTRQAYQIRLTTFGGNTQGIVSQLQAIFDMPDVEEVLLNVAIASQATRLPLTHAFSAVLVVSPTVVEDGSGTVRLLILDKDAVGPLVLAIDATGGSVAGHGDFIVRGY